MNKLIYITYQVFPNIKANTLQTVRMLEHFVINNIDTELIFPDRDKSRLKKENIFDFYDVDNKFLISKHKHFLPFGRFGWLNNSFSFLISSFLWSMYIVNKTMRKVENDTTLMTRTHWILFFLAKYKNNIIYECHKFSKIDKFVFNKISDTKNIIVIFTNKELMNAFDLSKNIKNNSIVLESSFEEKYFENNQNPKLNNSVIFAGNLIRFEQERNLNFLLEAFKDKRLDNYKLKIIGGPDYIAKKIKRDNLSKNIEILGRLSHKNTIKEIQKSEIGILINSPDKHSKLHTSPIKYFEYIRGGLKVLAVDFSAHKQLPSFNNLYFYKHDDREDFIKNLINTGKNKFISSNEIVNYSYKSRVNKLLNHIARLEGLEPPTL
tara:strand:- start:3858 stop:4991 length:1134 start_codon:yes stop_codon:yes gene_type:complete